MMQRIVKWSPRETSEAGWRIPQRERSWLAGDVDEGHVESFDLCGDNLGLNPNLAEAVTSNGKIGTIREMNHEVREGQGIFIFLVDFSD